MKKTLFIHHATGWGGAPINMINIINSIDSRYYKVKVLLLKDSIVSSKLKENNIDYSIATSFFYRKMYTYYSHTEAGYTKWFQIYKLIALTFYWLANRFYFAANELKNHEFDIVHINSSVLTDWLAPCSKKGKIIYHIQEPLTRGTSGLRYAFFRNQVKKYADQIIAISEDNAKRIGLPEKTEVIYNYSEIPANPPPEHSYSSKKFLYLGGSNSIKGFYIMVEALDYLDKDVRVYFCGSYALSKRSRNVVKRILKWVLFYGKKRKAAIEKMRNHPNAIEIGMTNGVQKYLNEVCCLISPFSVPHFSRPVIEAHLHKKPAIGTDVKGMDEIIEHGKNGLIVPKDNAKALAEAINSLSADSQKAKMLGEAGYCTAIKKFTPKNIHLYQSLYDKLF